MNLHKIGYAMMVLLATGFASCEQAETETLDQSAKLNVIPVVEGTGEIL